MAEGALIVAIDGPAGAGKSTIAKGVAAQLGLTRVDTGAIYRAVTLLSLERGLEAEAEIAALLPDLDLHFEGERVFLGDREVTAEIRSPEVNAHVSRVSALEAVRAGLLDVQRRLAWKSPRGAVMEGRDIGTVVFPEADVKVFLTASAEERARRRLEDLRAAGVSCGYDEVLDTIRERDRLDSSREHAPLREPEGATRVDSTGMTIPQVVDRIVFVVRSRARG